MDANALYQVKMWIFFLPVPIAVIVAWHCRKRGARFSRRLVYVLPFLLPVVFHFVQLMLYADLMSPIVGKNGELAFIAPYGCSALTSGALTLLKRVSTFVRTGIGALSFPELFCLHAGVLSLGLSLGFFIALYWAVEFGYTRL